jgi:predicted nucleic acid-binding protein
VIVADTNLISYLLIEGERTEAARKVWAEDSSWVMPPLWRSEFLNVLATAHRAGVLSEDQALLAWQRAKALLGASEVEPNGERVLQLAIERGISAYDAQFVAVADELHIRLVTADKRLLERCKDEAISIEDFTATSS